MVQWGGGGGGVCNSEFAGLPRGCGHGPFDQKGPLQNPRGCGKKRAVRGCEGAVKEPQNLNRGHKRFLNTAIHQSPLPDQ